MIATTIDFQTNLKLIFGGTRYFPFLISVKSLETKSLSSTPESNRNSRISKVHIF